MDLLINSAPTFKVNDTGDITFLRNQIMRKERKRESEHRERESKPERGEREGKERGERERGRICTNLYQRHYYWDC